MCMVPIHRTYSTYIRGPCKGKNRNCMALLLGLIIIIKMCRSDLYDYQVHIMVVLAYFRVSLA